MITKAVDIVNKYGGSIGIEADTGESGICEQILR